jgi:hypothetical protein
MCVHGGHSAPKDSVEQVVCLIPMQQLLHVPIPALAQTAINKYRDADIVAQLR